MIRVERVLGSLAQGYAPSSAIDELWLTRWEAQRRRLRKRTRGGRDVAVALLAPQPLADGHVLYADAEATVVVRVEVGDVVVFRLDPAADTHTYVVRALRLGHVLGNQHWPLRIQRSLPPADAGGPTVTSAEAVEILVPLALDRRVVQAVIESHRLEGVTYYFRAAAAGEALDSPAPPPAHQDDHAYPCAPGHDHLDHLSADGQSGAHRHPPEANANGAIHGGDRGDRAGAGHHVHANG
jgi:urease accessory protein